MSKATHEPPELLSAETQDVHRALLSLIEELEATDWYWQRAEATTDDELRQVLLHHRNEEIEHASMLVEWLRRRSPVFDAQIRRHVGREGPIVLENSGVDDSDSGPRARAQLGLGIGSLKGE